jgi:hypothetical protein
MGFRIVTKGVDGRRKVVDIHKGGDARAALKDVRLRALDREWSINHPGERIPGPRIVG